MPAGAVYVGRPSRWGNPYRRESYDGWPEDQISSLMVDDFRGLLDGRWPGHQPYPAADEIRRELGNATALACWCALDQPCHADVLIDLLGLRELSSPAERLGAVPLELAGRDDVRFPDELGAQPAVVHLLPEGGGIDAELVGGLGERESVHAPIVGDTVEVGK